MEININLKHIGHAVGTIGWLAENAHHIHIGACKNGTQGAWLKDKTGKTITVLALAGEEGAHNWDGIDVVTREVGIWQLSCDIYTTDAAWSIIEQLAAIARENMRESEELAAGYKISVGVA